MTDQPSLSAFSLNGLAALEFVVRGSPYGTVEQAVARLAVFSHPQTVSQTHGQPLFRIIRGPIPDRGKIVGAADGGRVLLDDNTGPTDAFLWANRIGRRDFTDVQFCHVWPGANSVAAYTNLANVCLLPAFLAKLSDTHPAIQQLLRFRAESLFHWKPAGTATTAPSHTASTLDWAECLPPNADIEGSIRQQMATKAKSRTTNSARAIGWLFSGWAPDASLPGAS